MALFEFPMQRRELLRTSMCGFGGLALHSMVADLARAATTSDRARGAGGDGPKITPKAQRVIFLFMGGGPSQPDLFDSHSWMEYTSINIEHDFSLTNRKANLTH